MLDWTNREILIQEYKQDLKTATKQHRVIAKKKYRTKVIVGGREIDKSMDDRTAEELAEQAKYAEIISSTKYALYWLENGFEQPYEADRIKGISRCKREQLWGKIEMIEFRGIKSQMELSFEDHERIETERHGKKGQLEQLKEILSVLSEREKELFELKHTAILTEEECAEKMGIALGTVKSMSQRIRDKIDSYFEYGHQMDLLDMFY